MNGNRTGRAPSALAALALGVLAIAVSAARAQTAPPQPLPFIEPSETAGHHHKVRELVLEAHPNATGQWQTLDQTMPINPVHVALMHTGKVLVVSGSGNDPNNHNLQAAVWDPVNLTVRTFAIGWDMFCNGMVVLPDGKPLVLGGTVKYDSPWIGEPRTAEFDPATEKFTNTRNMTGGRWYPTGTVLADGQVLVYSGLDVGSINSTVEIGTGRTWKPAGTAFGGVPLYPREHVLPDGRVFVSGSNVTSQFYDSKTHVFTAGPATLLPTPREYGTSVLLPLTVAGGWKPRVMILGGGSGANESAVTTATTELIDLAASTPAWAAGPPMVQARMQLNATLLPDGKVLVSGGSTKDEDSSTAVKEAQLYDPAANTFSPAGAMEFPRLYHSNTLLLPDGRVAALGGNPERTVYVPEIEIYSPPYLFNADGSAAKRPVIASAPHATHYGAQIQVRTPDAAAVKSVVMIRAGAVTHAFDMDQRLVELSFENRGGALHAQAPADGKIAPPGYYLLFLVDTHGVPSVAQFVHLTAPARAAIARPAAAKEKPKSGS
jgi:hypothetical protein